MRLVRVSGSVDLPRSCGARLPRKSAACTRRGTGRAGAAPPTASAALRRQRSFTGQQSLEDAKAVFDLVWFERRERRWQFGDGDRRAPGVDAQHRGSVPRAPVQIDPQRREVELRADAQRRVVHRELADAVSQVSDPENHAMQLIEGGHVTECALLAREPRAELSKHVARDSPLVGVLPPSAVRARAACLTARRSDDVAR